MTANHQTAEQLQCARNGRRIITARENAAISRAAEANASGRCEGCGTPLKKLEAEPAASVTLRWLATAAHTGRGG